MTYGDPSGPRFETDRLAWPLKVVWVFTTIVLAVDFAAYSLAVDIPPLAAVVFAGYSTVVVGVCFTIWRRPGGF